MHHSQSNASVSKNRTVNQSTVSLERAQMEGLSNENSKNGGLVANRDQLHSHVNSTAQVIVTKLHNQSSKMYTRKNNHKHAIETTGPSAHYTEFFEDKRRAHDPLRDHKESQDKNMQAFFDDTTPPVDTVYGNNFPNG